MIRILILTSLSVIVSGNWLSSHLQNYPSGLERLFGAKREVSTRKDKDERSLCENEECKLIANVIKESMDETVDPCEDFYEYACGHWSNTNPTPEDEEEWSLWSMVQKRINKQIEEIIETEAKPSDLFAVKLSKKWYKTCMDTDGIERRGVEPILSTLWRHGGWPLIMEEGEWDDRVYTWQIVDDQYSRLIGMSTFHDLVYNSFTYEGNDTIIIHTPHLPMRIYSLVPEEPEEELTDASDENNESGEGSQERGSKERGHERSKESEDADENGENNEDDGDEDESDEDENEEVAKRRRIAGKKINRRMGHAKRKSKSHLKKSHVGHKRTRRPRRDVAEGISLSRQQHRHRKVSNHGLQHHMKRRVGKLSRRAHLSANKKKLQRKKSAKKRTHKQLGHVRNKHDKVKGNHADKKGTISRTSALSHKRRKLNDHRARHIVRKADTDTENEENNDEEHENTDENNNDEGGSEDSGNVSGDTNDEDDGNSENDDGNSENDDGESDEEEDNDNEDGEDESGEEDEDEDDSVDIEANKEEYRNYILNVSLILSKGRDVEVPREVLEKKIDDIIEFAIKMVNIAKSDYDNLMNGTLESIQEWYDSLNSTTDKSKVNWKGKVKKMFAEAGVDIEDDVEVTVINPVYLEDLAALLDETPKETIVNYVHWLFVEKALIAAPAELRNLFESWNEEQKPFDTRKDECLQLVQMTDILGYEYVRTHFSEKLAKTARDMIDDIQKEVEYQIKGSTWMDDDTKHFILDKLVHMKNMIGFPDWFQNTTMVKRYYRGLTLGPSHYENLINYLRYRKWKSLRYIVDHDEFPEELVDPLMLNAFFIPTENSIAITAVDFQSPFFSVKRPWNVNFGIIGVVMAHEVNHGFDDQGHLFDRKGRLMEWLSAMAAAYDSRAECFIDQFNKYSIFKDENYTVENYGQQTTGENIADTMGLQAVYRAYHRRQRVCDKPDPALPGLEKFTNDQIFFLSFAQLWCESTDRKSLIRQAENDVHSTGRLRVIGSVSNSDDFAKTFNCPVGSPMNPKKKCNIWI